MDMAVVIPTAGGRVDLVERALRSLTVCTVPDVLRETIVIENGDKRGIEEVVGKFGSRLNIRYVFEPRANKSAALNAVLRRFDHDFLVFLDDDVRVSVDLLQAYVRVAEQYGPGHFFGGPFECDYESPPEAPVLPYLPASARGWRLPDGQSGLGHGEYFKGCNWAAFTSDLKAAGGFDDMFGPGSPSGATGQETMMQNALLANGRVAVYVPSAMAWHYVPLERASRRWVLERQFRNGVSGAMMNRMFESNRVGWLKYSIARLSQSCGQFFLGLLTLSPDRRFAARANMAEWRGIRQGIAIRNSGNSRERAVE
jgi:glycosyltransferase involved in cell wall biosynthesis